MWQLLHISTGSMSYLTYQTNDLAVTPHQINLQIEPLIDSVHLNREG